MEISLPIPAKFKRLFWKRVVVKGIGDCWEWIGSKDPAGYGLFNYFYRRFLAHRFAYTLIYGPIKKGLLVCHICNNKGCVNPLHLYAGSHADNTQDIRGGIRRQDQHFIDSVTKLSNQLKGE